MRLLHAALAAALVATLGLPAFAQAAKADPPAARPIPFDVISVKPSRAASSNASMGMNRDGFTAGNIQLHDLLMQAFNLQEADQLLAEPKWTTNDRWDIEARVAAEDIPALEKLTYRERLGMFQAILTERFGLKTHHETRTLPVYALVVDKGGPKMTPSKPQPNDPEGWSGNPGVLNTSAGKETGRGALIEFLAEDLSDVVGRKVVDHTTLTGRYDFTLIWSPDDATTAASAQSQAPSLFTAVQEQLGLKLEPVKAPIDVVVIDHLEKPAEN